MIPIRTSDLLDILGRFFANDVYDVVQGHDAFHVPLRIHDRERHKTIGREETAQLLLVHRLGHRDQVRLHQFLDPLVRPRRQELSE